MYIGHITIQFWLFNIKIILTDPTSITTTTMASADVQAPVDNQQTNNIDNTTDNTNNTPVSSVNDINDSNNNNTIDMSNPHKLHRSWTLYYTPPVETKTSKGPLDTDAWSNLLKKVTTVNTVEEFWLLFNSIKTPLNLTIGASYHLFADNIQPEWEDVANKDGGRWSINIRRNSDSINDVDDKWINMCMYCIGELNDYSQYINGVVVSAKNRDIRLQIWTKQGDNESVQLNIGRNIKQVCKVNDRIDYNLHFSKSRSADYIL